MINMDRDTFQRLVSEALDDLPAIFQDKLDNIQVVVEDWPEKKTMQLANIKNRAQLLGFYHGIPRTKRSRGYNLVLPDKISIYRRPILMQCRTDAQVRATVARVLRHEIGHHFGISDERLREIGAY